MRYYVINQLSSYKKLIVFIRYTIFILIAVCFFSAAANDSLAGESDIQKSDDISQIFEKAWFYLTQMHIDKQALVKAKDILIKAEKMDPSNKEVYWRLAEITFKMADEEKDPKKRKLLYEKTVDYSEKALRINPQSLEGYYWKGCSNARLAEMAGILSALGLVKEAKNSLFHTISIDNHHRYSILSKAVLAAIFTVPPWPLRDLDQAETLALEAVRQDPSLTIASQNLAMVYIAQKKKAEARAELTRGLSISTPTYVWDSQLYDWPKMRELLKDLDK